MSANVPFLAKFAKQPPKDEEKLNSGSAVSEKGTNVTRVNRETTDDR